MKGNRFASGALPDEQLQFVIDTLTRNGIEWTALKGMSRIGVVQFQGCNTKLWA